MATHLIKLEFLKFKNHKTILLFLGMYIVALSLPIFIGGDSEITSAANQYTMDYFLGFPNIWKWYGYYFSWITFFFLGFITLTTVSSEFKNKTLRQSIIIGLTRTDYFIAKLSQSKILSFLSIILFSIIAIFIGIKNSTYATFFENLPDLTILTKGFLLCMAYCGFALLVALIFRNNSLSVFFYVCYIFFIESIIRNSLNYYLNTDILNYLPMNVISNLFPMPVYNIIENTTGTSLMSIDISENGLLALAFTYILVFFGLAYLVLIKRDI